MAVKHETCSEYFKRRLSEGWKCISLSGYQAVLLAPWGFRRVVDLRNDIETLRPNGAGAETTITTQYPDSGAHWEKVDEETPDDLSTYIREGTSSTYNRDLYNLPSHSEGAGTINSVTVYARVRKGGIVARNLAKLCIKSGSTVSESEEKSVPTSWGSISKSWDTNPATESAWTWDEIDDLQIGIALKRYDATEYPTCTQVYVEVDYIAITAKTSSDLGSGVEARASGSPLASLGQSDSGSGADDTPSQAAMLNGYEAGSGLEALLSLFGKLASDAGSGVEISYLSIITSAKSSADSGSGTDISSLLSAFEQGEGGIGLESLLSRLLHHGDSGTGSDSCPALLARLTKSESGSGADALLARLLKAGESGSGIEGLLSREVCLTDAGSAIEVAAICKLLTATDNGAGLEVLSGLVVLIPTSEGGHGSERLGVKIATSPGAGEMNLFRQKGKTEIPSKGVEL
jgi:hypothetical protein